MEEITIKYGGLNIDRLYQELDEHNIYMNDYAKHIVEHPRFTLTPEQNYALCMIVSIEELGLTKGAALVDIFSSASSYGLTFCTLEMALYFRLSYHHLNDSSGLKSQGRAPSDAITIATVPLESADDFPKGLYIRKIDSKDWLRGYTCDNQYHFSPQDKFLFKQMI